MQFKYCYKCDSNKSLDNYYKNKTKPDGLQNICTDCSKNYGKVLTCTNCNCSFKINHRNLKKRKTNLCSACAQKESNIKLIERNKSRKKEFIYSTKGYIYLKNQDLTKGYKLAHRKEVEKHLNRKLEKNEVVHHIDGNKTNNQISNLFLTDQKGHSKAHRSLELIGYYLIQNDLVRFNSELGIYELIIKD